MANHKANDALCWQVIVNPISGGKKGIHTWKQLQKKLNESHISYQVYFSEYKGHLIEIASELCLKNEKKFIVVGGDGTAHEVVNGIFSTMQDTSSILIAMVSAGTGNDWVKTIGKHSSMSSLIESLRNLEIKCQDLGVIEYSYHGKQLKRYFINIAGFGFDGFVAKKLSGNNGLFKGTKIHYWFALLKSLLFYQHNEVLFKVDDEKIILNTLSVAAGICKYNGGGLKQLPHALIDDGHLDMSIIGNMSKLKMVRNLSKLHDGSFINVKGVKTYRAKEIVLECKELFFAEADGEYLGEAPVRLSILPSALRFVLMK